jgi:hypothetical protein
MVAVMIADYMSCKKMASLWLPVLIQMAFIYGFSAQPAGSPALEMFPVPAGMGHFIGYAILGLFLYRAFNGGLYRWSRGAAEKTLLVGVVYAVSDELHQLFVPGREASISDFVIDALGLSGVLLVVWVISRIKVSDRC